MKDEPYFSYNLIQLESFNTACVTPDIHDELQLVEFCIFVAVQGVFVLTPKHDTNNHLAWNLQAPSSG